jgi:predicted phosphoadenosine phosphosulfate sulfurtransferase
MSGLVKVYREQNVLEAARERMRLIFDRFERVFVSVSGGKDSGVLARLAMDEARSRGRTVGLFFLDQEAEYQATIDLMRGLMHDPVVVPLWYQVPIYMTNATSYEQDMLYAWGPGEEWMREQEPDSIRALDGDYPQRFYDFFDWWEDQQPDGSAFLVGLRAEEGIKRFRAVTKNPGIPGLKWSSRTKKPNSFKLYPIYDWGIGDIWKFTADEQIPYNRVYDLRYAMGCGTYNDNRVSNLIHEMAFRALVDLAALEPLTYAKLIRRLKGVHCAARHAQSAHLYDVRTLPARFATWRAYRDHLLATMPVTEAKRARFQKRFDKQPATEPVHHAQCKQLLVGDWENNVPIPKGKTKPADRFARWRKLF